MSKIVKAVQRSARAVERTARWSRILEDARARGDIRTARKAERLVARACSDFDAAQRATRFPWEVIDTPDTQE